jgi:hypothetical protein
LQPRTQCYCILIEQIYVVQALPYCWTLLFIPTHFMSFELLLLATGLWTTNIHDTVDGKVGVCGEKDRNFKS